MTEKRRAGRIDRTTGRRGAERPSRRAGSVWRFVTRFALTWIGGYVVLRYLPGLETAWLTATRFTTDRLLDAVGSSYSVDGAGGILLRVSSLRIDTECTSLDATLLLVAVIASLSLRWTSRAGAMLAGAAMLWVVNLGRIVGLCLVMDHWPRGFDFMHLYLWQFATVLLIVTFVLPLMGKSTQEAWR